MAASPLAETAPAASPARIIVTKVFVRGLKVEPAGKNTKPNQYILFSVGKQIVAPCDRLSHRLLALRSFVRPATQHIQLLLEPVKYCLRS